MRINDRDIVTALLAACFILIAEGLVRLFTPKSIPTGFIYLLSAGVLIVIVILIAKSSLPRQYY